MQAATRSSFRSWYLVLALAAGWASVASPLPAQVLPSPTQNAVAGAAVFGAEGCVQCHSIGGAESIGPDLSTIGADRSFQDLTAALWNHLPGMSRRMADLGIETPHLSPREAGDLFAYLYTLGYFDDEGDAERGSRLFTGDELHSLPSDPGRRRSRRSCTRSRGRAGRAARNRRRHVEPWSRNDRSGRGEGDTAAAHDRS